MQKIRLLLWKIFRPLPDVIIEGPHHITFVFLKFFFKATIPNCKIGYRNSLRYSCIEPFFSDLDITIMCDETSRLKVLNSYQFFKKIIPLLGELNLYSYESFESAKADCNLFERDRDPLLGSENKNPRSVSKAEKFVFAFRMLDADWDTLLNRPSTRQRKWDCHFKCLDYPPLQSYDHNSVLRFILNEIGSQDEISLVLKFRNRFAVDKKTRQFDDLNQPLIQTVFFNRLCYLKPSTDLSPLQKEIIAAQARWEFWAMEVARKTSVDNQTKHHLGNVEKFLNSF